MFWRLTIFIAQLLKTFFQDIYQDIWIEGYSAGKIDGKKKG